MLTLLLTDGQPGLQINYKGEWIDVPPRPDCFVVNLGDMLERLAFCSIYSSDGYSLARPIALLYQREEKYREGEEGVMVQRSLSSCNPQRPFSLYFPSSLFLHFLPKTSSVFHSHIRIPFPSFPRASSPLTMVLPLHAHLA